MINSQLGSDRDEQLALVVDEFFDAVAEGETPEISDYLRRYPEIADELKVVIPAMLAMEHAASRSEPTSFQNTIPQEKLLGDFRILRPIGRGGMGVVYEAEQVSMKRRVALKVLPLAGLVDELKIHRFQNEVRAVAALNHPNIVPVYMVGQERGVHYYAMQLIQGRSLSDIISSLQRVREDGKLLDGATISRITNIGRAQDAVKLHGAGAVIGSDSAHSAKPSACETIAADANDSTIPHSSRREYLRSVAALGIQAASALQHAHEQGVIHRDIKPANLLLDTSATLFVTDFGLARMESDVGVTMTGDLIGTLRYMAPEQALAKRVVVDHRADIYSLGVTLYELVALQPAYRAEDRQQLLKQIAFEEPTPLRRLDRDTPTELETIIHKAMSKDMDQRYASAQELADDLRSHLNNQPIKAKPPTISEAIVKWTRRNPILTWATIITLSLITMTLAASTLLISKQLARATMAEREAKTAQGEADARAGELARRNYLQHIASADTALLQNEYLRAQTELDECPPEQRGQEWHYLFQRLQSAFPMSLPGAEQPIFTQGGKRLTAIGAFENKTPVLNVLRNHFAITWDLESGQVVGDPLEHHSRLGHLAVASNEKRIAGGDYAGNLFVWDVDSREKLWSEKVHESSCQGLVFSPDGRLIASAAYGRLIVVDATNGQVQYTLGPFKSDIRKVMFSPNGQWIASGMTGKHPAILVDVTTGNIAARFSEEGGNMLPTFDPSGNRIATAHIDGSIKLWSWDGIDLRELTSWKAAEKAIISLSFSADGSKLFSSEIYSNRNTVWNAATGKPLATFRSRDHVYWSAFSPDGNTVALFSITGGIRIWRYGPRRFGREINVLAGAAEAKFSPDGTYILVATPMYYDGSGLAHRVRHFYTPEPAKILDAESGNVLRSTHEAVYAASWSPDGREIVATGESGESIRTYDVATGEPLRDFRGNTGRFTKSRVDPTGRRLVSFSTDASIRAWVFASGEEEFVGQLDGMDHGFMGLGADFSHDVNFLCAGGSIWDTRSMTRACKIHHHPGHWEKKFTFSHDGNHVYIGCSGGLLKQVDTVSGQHTKLFVGHLGHVRAIAIAPDSKQIVAGDTTGRVIVWDVESQRPLVTLDDRGRLVSSLDWSSDGRRIVAGKEDGTVEIWTLPSSP